MTARGHSGAAVATAGVMISVVGTFLPWLRSGSRNRSSYTIFDLVERLGFAPGGAVAWSLRIWPLVPLVLALAAIAVWVRPTTGRSMLRTAETVLTIVAVVWVGGTSVAVMLAPAMGLFRVGPGPLVTLVGVGVLAIGAALGRRATARS